jgi:hypothetical protein
MNIMRNVTASHEKTIIANRGQAAAAFRPRIHRNMFADTVTRPDFKACRFSFELQILRDFTEYRKREHNRIRTDFCHPTYHNVAL